MIEITKRHVFFFKDWMSNFHPAPFDMITIKGIYEHFETSEQAFMYQKALCFNDEETAKRILGAATPLQAKTLGRQVRNYDDEIWDAMRFEYMYACNYHKYDQNPELKKRFMDPQYKDHIFVEASPFDPIWGIALDRKKVTLDFMDNENNWKGQNLMGKVLTEVYKTFESQEK